VRVCIFRIIFCAFNGTNVRPIKANPLPLGILPGKAIHAVYATMARPTLMTRKADAVKIISELPYAVSESTYRRFLAIAILEHYSRKPNLQLEHVDYKYAGCRFYENACRARTCGLALSAATTGRTVSSTRPNYRRLGTGSVAQTDWYDRDTA